MRYADTESAGGDAKNRLVDRTIHLEKGDYVVHYVTDDSHSYDDWNAAAPVRRPALGHHAARRRRARSIEAAVAEYAEKADPSVIAQIVRVRDDESPRKTFKLDRETQVRIYALGEGSGRSLADYGWIEDAQDRQDGLGDDLSNHRTRRRRGQEPPVRRRHHAPRRRVLAPLRDRRLAFLRLLERESARRSRHVGDHRLSREVRRRCRHNRRHAGVDPLAHPALRTGRCGVLVPHRAQHGAAAVCPDQLRHDSADHPDDDRQRVVPGPRPRPARRAALRSHARGLRRLLRRPAAGSSS